MKLLPLLALLALAAPAHAAPLESSVSLSPEVEADPALASFLREEAEAIVADYTARAAESAGAAWQLEIRDRATYAGPRFISVLRQITEETGGAGPLNLVEGLTWDRTTQDFVRLDAFLASGGQGRSALGAIARNLRIALVSEVHDGAPGETWTGPVVRATVPDVIVLQNFTLAPSTGPLGVGGVTFHFSALEVAPNSAGPISITIPQMVFRDGVDPALGTLFTGDPQRLNP
ncbi:MAG: RsiV family protein [Pseudomonadota bacterium]